MDQTSAKSYNLFKEAGLFADVPVTDSQTEGWISEMEFSLFVLRHTMGLPWEGTWLWHFFGYLNE